MELNSSEAQWRHREVGSEGSVEQRYGPVDKPDLRPAVSGERAIDRETHIHQGHWW
jgi:hypothetical protein